MTGPARPAVLEHLPWRITGLVLLGALVVLYHPEQGGVIHRLLIPVGMALATWLLVQNLAAVALGAGLLAGLHSAPGAADWVHGVAYPVLAGACAVVVVALFTRRFRRHIAATHEARWTARRRRRGHDAP